MLHNFLLAFIPIFVAVDVFAVLPYYISISKDISAKRRRAVMLQALLTACVISISFIFIGRWVFRILHITVNDFKIAGGLLLLVIAILDVVLPEKIRKKSSDTIGVVPIGMPLIVGPAVLTTSIMLVDAHGIGMTLLSLLVNFLIVACAFSNAPAITHVLGDGGTKAISKVTSLLLAAIAVMMIRMGIQGLIPT